MTKDHRPLPAPPAVHAPRAEPGSDGKVDLTRRRFLQGAGLMGAATFLTACGRSDLTVTPALLTPSASAPDIAETPAPSLGSGSLAGPLRFANWDAYIDIDEDGDSPTIVEFEAAHDITVEYANGGIVDDESFLASIQPALEQGVSTGWDLIVLSDWMAARLVASGWTEELDPGHVPSAIANVRAELRGRPWDPDMAFHFPWQSVVTGLGYNRASTGRELTGIADLFDPALAGKVTLLDDMRATLPLVHLALQAQGNASDNAPESMTVQDAEVVIEYLRPFVEDGHIRAFTGSEYLTDLGSGDTWAAMVWSGDFASSASPDDVFAYPEKGAIIRTHSLLVPKGAEHKHAAESMIDWVYDVDRAARLANWIYYLSPVTGVAEAIATLDPKAASNPLLFPPADVVARLHPPPVFSAEDDLTVREMFTDLTGP